MAVRWVFCLIQGPRPAKETLGAEWPSIPAVPTAPLQRRKPGRASSSLLRKPSQAGWKAAAVWAWGLSWLSFLGFSQVLHLPWEVQSQDCDPELCAAFAAPLFHFPWKLAARCCVPGVQPSIRPFLTRCGVRISCSNSSCAYSKFLDRKKIHFC